MGIHLSSSIDSFFIKGGIILYLSAEGRLYQFFLIIIIVFWMRCTNKV